MEKLLIQLQEEAELDVLEELPSDQKRSNRKRDPIVKVVELSQRQNGQQRFRLVTGVPGDCKVRLALLRRKLAPEEGSATNVDTSTRKKLQTKTAKEELMQKQRHMRNEE